MEIQECYNALHGDYENAKMRLMSDKLIEKFLRKFPTDPSMSQLLEAVETHDIEGSFIAAHTLKGVSANMAFTELLDNVSALTEQLRPRTEEADPALLDAVKKSYSLVMETIEKL